MKYFFFIFLTLSIYTVSSAQKIDFLELSRQELYEITFNSFENVSLENVRISSSTEEFLLDSLIIYQYISDSDSIPYRKIEYFYDEYAKQSLETDFSWSESENDWFYNYKIEKSINPINDQINYNKHHNWNTTMENWLLSDSYNIYYNDKNEIDSVVSLYYTENGEISHGYRRIEEWHPIENMKIIFEDYFSNEYPISAMDNKSELYYNDAGSLLEELRLSWDDTENGWRNYQEIKYTYDTLGFESYIITQNWNEEMENWEIFSKDTEGYNASTSLFERFRYRWDKYTSNWIKNDYLHSQTDQNGRTILWTGGFWSRDQSIWIPNFKAEWIYDETHGEIIVFKESSNWDLNTNTWQTINTHQFYYEGGLRSEIQKFIWNDVEDKNELHEKDFYHYSLHEYISNIPPELDTIIGPDTLCVNSSDVVYKSQWDKDIKSFDWQIIPQEAGSFETSDSLMYLSLSEDYSGSLGISVAGVNGFGIGEYSDTLAIYIKPAPEKPKTPVGQELINQFTGTVNYTTEEQTDATDYNWHYSPVSSGEMKSEKNTANFTLSDQYEGALYFSVQSENECGLSPFSDSLEVNAYFKITDIPKKAQLPIGPDTLCQNETNATYEVIWQIDMESVHWNIIPFEAGSIEQHNTTIQLDLAKNYEGELGISVAGENSFGIGEYSDTLSVYIKLPPEKPAIPRGPENINQFSGIVEYTVNQDQNASAYYWHLEPIEAGELSLNYNKAIFDYNLEYEGECSLTVDASNECGSSELSDALLVITEIIDTATLLPPQLPMPIGPDTVCTNDTDVIFKTIKHDTVSSYLWNLYPEDVGTLHQNDTIISLNLNEVYSGNLKISVAGQNTLGQGEYSDTLEIYVKDVPAKPAAISGPQELNQYFEQNEYSIEKVSFVDQYNWNLDPSDAGELKSKGISAQFDVREGFEGDVEISVSAANECGQSEPSDLKLVSVKIVSGLINDVDEYGIKIFPNPALNEINISSQEFIEIKNINIINAQGITIWSKNDLSKFKAQTISIDFPPGIYTILFEIENILLYQKIVIE